MSDTPARREGGSGVPALTIGRRDGTSPTQRIEAGERPPARGHGRVDICFVFDTTGSMSNKIDGLVNCTAGFVAELAQLQLDWRVTVVPFGDLTVQGDTIETALPFVTTVEPAQTMLRQMRRNSGGSNAGESSLEAIRAGLAKQFRQDAVKVLVVLTDEPALQPQRAGAVTRELLAAEAIAFVCSPALQYYQAIATQTGGTWHLIGSSVDFGEVTAMLRHLVQDVARTSAAVHALAGGSVKRFRELPESSRRLPGGS